MEIRIKTHEELRADRVTIEITGTGAEVRQLVDSEASTEFYDPQKAAEVLAENYARASARIKELEKGRAADHKEIVALREKAMGYDLDRHTERDRADRLKTEVAALTRRIDNARVILSGPQVTGALNRAVRDQHESGLMAQAIEKALDTLA